VIERGPTLNDRFARTPARPEDAHIPSLDPVVLYDMFCTLLSRAVWRDFIITSAQRFYPRSKHLLPHPSPGDRVTVRLLAHGTSPFHWKDRSLLVEEFHPQEQGRRDRKPFQPEIDGTFLLRQNRGHFCLALTVHTSGIDPVSVPEYACH